MPAWKVLFIMMFGLVCLTLAFATILIPLSDYAGKDRWLWLAGLLTATVLMSSLFAWYLRKLDRAFKL